MPAKSEEVVVHAHLIHIQQFRPDLCQKVFGRRSRSDVRLTGNQASGRRFGQRAAVDFAAGRQRQGGHGNVCPGNQSRRQFFRQIVAQRYHIFLAGRRAHEISH